jgi:hypothetical protein
MPKKYRIDMTIPNIETKTEISSDSHLEQYNDDKQAGEKFQLKKEAARSAGKGQAPRNASRTARD